ncbi:hypothetical protein A3F07_02165 [candidate division WWE3 bacterium RIFCSPHIGHO2_12_FULL_38_15]|uniref:VIT family protein n=1 Tax=candidate division WWE3 bacterium RIFCSPHIGHO2_02_FULL_38_14 TaxID=1802620 RepID=A0A1F4V8D8_UNCKA|nr:MAG: hypothetical protein A2793_03400 [candidate division WWE3 bacterium RIFCSPHIGHO2_01_FULL_38_45]OGC48686.1 MAG: hypothetical protein A3F07_02165 [candidate division WWE3 bacterium RIFCSPHIGHO2_12_FULL_38_15]OGC53092.1 MAG: hypothetical protein A3B64_01425 [candidate division WWE3 bacterium RIFCSPLOWO2_01_FULL_37_24]OGC53455.1 MAG: hypothetical protein A3D91_00280 [candidate division WWE3 bacterium RIFCSPHIGHO2_02_FULL_38_14]HLB51929.1 VIT1/CCC1 transporter family protein [Patescibacteria
MKKLSVDNIRNIIFGIEDSLVSTSGFLFGLATTSYETHQIFTSGIIIISVEAVSMGAGAFLTEEETLEMESKSSERKKANPLFDGILMFLSYFGAGFIPLLPYILLERELAKPVSMVLSFSALFLLGYLPTKKLKSAFRMLVVAGAAASVGYLVGSVF